MEAYLTHNLQSVPLLQGDCIFFTQYLLLTSYIHTGNIQFHTSIYEYAQTKAV